MQKFAPAMRVAYIYHTVDRPAALVIDDVPRAADTAQTSPTVGQKDKRTDRQTVRKRAGG